jgi:hypothetical protein
MRLLVLFSQGATAASEWPTVTTSDRVNFSASRRAFPLRSDRTPPEIVRELLTRGPFRPRWTNLNSGWNNPTSRVLSHVAKVEQYLKHAEECEQLALEASEPATKNGYTILAKEWRRMAKQVYRRAS